jgi:hypothetical protein
MFQEILRGRVAGEGKGSISSELLAAKSFKRDILGVIRRLALFS